MPWAAGPRSLWLIRVSGEEHRERLERLPNCGVEPLEEANVLDDHLPLRLGADSEMISPLRVPLARASRGTAHEHGHIVTQPPPPPQACVV